MTFHSAMRWDESYEEMVGTPDQVREDARNVPLPRLPIFARCTWCWTLNQVGAFYFPDEPIPLDDGTTTSFNDWRYEAQKGNANVATRWRRFHCSVCEHITDHLADKGKS